MRWETFCWVELIGFAVLIAGTVSARLAVTLRVEAIVLADVVCVP